MKIIRFAETIVKPRGNAPGYSRLVAERFSDADRAILAWRVFICQRNATSSLSLFPGFDRSLCLIEGEGLQLVSASLSTIVSSTSKPIHFAADEKIVATNLGSAESSDFNIMTRRGIGKHKTRRFALSSAIELPGQAGTTIIFAQSGRLAITSSNRTTELGVLDTAILVDPEDYQITPRTDAICILSTIEPAVNDTRPLPDGPQQTFLGYRFFR